MTSSSTRKPRAYRLDDPEVAQGSIVIGGSSGMTSSSTRKPRAYRLDDPEVTQGSIVIGDRLA